MDALSNRVERLERAVGAGGPERYVSVAIALQKGHSLPQEEFDLVLEAEAQRCEEARAAGREVAVVVRIGAHITGWRERLAARRGEV